MNALMIATPTAIDLSAVTWQEAIEPFLNTLDSPQTRRVYRAAIAEAMPRLAVATIDEITPAMLTTHRAGLVARVDARDAKSRLSPASVSLKLAALRSFLKFRRLTGLTRLTIEVITYCLESPSATVVKPYEVLTLAEQARVLATLADRPRDRALVALALGAGLRASELTGAKVGDVISDDDGAEWVIVRMGKGRKDRMIPLSPDVAQVLREHVTAHKLKRDDYLITSRQGDSGRITSARVWQIITDAVKAAGINKRLSPHSFRHSFAIGRLKAGASPVIVQKLLGHSSLSTTQKYIDHLELADLKQWAAPLPIAVT